MVPSIYKSKLSPILAFILIFITTSLVSSTTENLTGINNFLEKNLGRDFTQTYIGKPIINPIMDPNWDSFDVEKAKEFLNKDSLPPAKSIFVYPLQIDDVESSFRVIVFEDNSFYSELTIPVNISIGKDEAIRLAKEKGIKEPYNIVLMTNDNLFGWSIISTKNSNEMAEGEVSQVTIDLRSNNISSNIFNPIRYDEDSRLKIVLIVALFVVVLAVVTFQIYRRKNVKKN